jgi:hypothetical protein
MLENIIFYIKENVSWIKDLFTLIFVGIATIISILAYRRARATILQPIRNEVIKKQSKILTELLDYLSKERSSIDEGIDYVGVASISAFLTLKNYGFVFKNQKEILEKIDKIEVGWLYCGESKILKDVEVIGMLKEEDKREKSLKEVYHNGKEKFKNAKEGIIEIDKIYLTKKHKGFFEKLVEYADNPFLPKKIQFHLKEIVSAVQVNFTIHLKNALTKFVQEFCGIYFASENNPNVSPIGVYNEFNHNRIHHKEDLNKLKFEIRKYLRIDEEW